MLPSPVFQSSLELSHECNPLWPRPSPWLSQFQSSLELSHECNGLRVLRGAASGFGFNPHSSFRTSATHPAQPASGLAECFNPHSSFRTSATYTEYRHSSRSNGFNPHSSFRTSATQLYPTQCKGGVVSILTRAFARVQLSAARGRFHNLRFQSSLELSHECNYIVVTRSPLTASSFNPHSSFRTSATIVRLRPALTSSFNPHSSFRTSATTHVRGHRDRSYSFNPHSSFRTSATRRVDSVRLVHQHVSILTRAFARVQQG